MKEHRGTPTKNTHRKDISYQVSTPIPLWGMPEAAQPSILLAILKSQLSVLLSYLSDHSAVIIIKLSKNIQTVIIPTNHFIPVLFEIKFLEIIHHFGYILFGETTSF